MAPATSTSATRRRSTRIEAQSPGIEGGVLLELRRAHGAAAGGPRCADEHEARSVLRMRRADVGQRVRLLPSGGHGQRPRPRAGRTDDEEPPGSRPVAMNTPFAYGDKVLLLDNKQRRYLITLAEGGEFHSHTGFFAHSDLVGRLEGVVVTSTKGTPYTALRPTLEDFVVEMPRGAQVIYPKDLAPICMLADIGPGVRVLESGVGSGALSMTMLRWGAEIVGYELREDFANRAHDQRAQLPRRGGAGAIPRRAARLLRGHRRARRRSGGARPPRAVAGRAARDGGLAARRHPDCLLPRRSSRSSQLREALASKSWNGTR